MQQHLMDDANDVKTAITAIADPTGMSDSEIIFNMKQIKTWDKKIEDLVTGTRKLQVESIDLTDVGDIVSSLDEAVKEVKLNKHET